MSHLARAPRSGIDSKANGGFDRPCQPAGCEPLKEVVS